MIYQCFERTESQRILELTEDMSEIIKLLTEPDKYSLEEPLYRKEDIKADNELGIITVIDNKGDIIIQEPIGAFIVVWDGQISCTLDVTELDDYVIIETIE